MPTYDYRCAKCGDELEVFQTFAEKALTKHAGCGGKLAKVLSPAGIVLQGSGFYKTANRSSTRSGAGGGRNGRRERGGRARQRQLEGGRERIELRKLGIEQRLEARFREVDLGEVGFGEVGI